VVLVTVTVVVLTTLFPWTKIGKRVMTAPNWVTTLCVKLAIKDVTNDPLNPAAICGMNVGTNVMLEPVKRCPADWKKVEFKIRLRPAVMLEAFPPKKTGTSVTESAFVPILTAW